MYILLAGIMFLIIGIYTFFKAVSEVEYMKFLNKENTFMIMLILKEMNISKQLIVDTAIFKRKEIISFAMDILDEISKRENVSGTKI